MIYLFECNFPSSSVEQSINPFFGLNLRIILSGEPKPKKILVWVLVCWYFILINFNFISLLPFLKLITVSAWIDGCFDDSAPARSASTESIALTTNRTQTKRRANSSSSKLPVKVLVAASEVGLVPVQAPDTAMLPSPPHQGQAALGAIDATPLSLRMLRLMGRMTSLLCWVNQPQWRPGFQVDSCLNKVEARGLAMVSSPRSFTNVLYIHELIRSEYDKMDKWKVRQERFNRENKLGLTFNPKSWFETMVKAYLKFCRPGGFWFKNWWRNHNLRRVYGK